MLASVAPRYRLLLAGGLILGLVVLAPMGGLSAPGVARWLLGAAALAGLAWWLRRRGGEGPRFPVPERLRVISRTGLSQRCGIALVEADGQSFVVVFGDAFAQIHQTPLCEPLPEEERRPGRRSPPPLVVRSKGVLQ